MYICQRLVFTPPPPLRTACNGHYWTLHVLLSSYCDFYGQKMCLYILCNLKNWALEYEPFELYTARCKRVGKTNGFLQIRYSKSCTHALIPGWLGIETSKLNCMC